jgi:group I intron endonuclease
MLSQHTFIYILKDPITNEVRYVGKSDNPKKRLSEHINKSKHTSTYKNNWLKNLKKNNLKPILEIIDVVDKSNWGELEKKWITHFKEIGSNLTNQTEGGDGGNFGEKINLLISKKLKGGKFTEHTLKLMSESAKKRKLSDNGRQSLSEKRKGVKNPMYGKKQTTHCIESKYKSVLQFSLNNEFIQEWKSLKEVSEYLLINRNTIRMVCNNQRISAGGYKWKFK